VQNQQSTGQMGLLSAKRQNPKGQTHSGLTPHCIKPPQKSDADVILPSPILNSKKLYNIVHSNLHYCAFLHTEVPDQNTQHVECCEQWNESTVIHTEQRSKSLLLRS